MPNQARTDSLRTIGRNARPASPKTLRLVSALSAVIVLFAVGRAALAQPLKNVPREQTWVTVGPVYAILPTANTIYVGGSFFGVGLPTGQGVPVDATTGQIAPVFPKVQGPVNACVADGSGGWYIGGDFTRVGGLTRNRLAHIRADGTVDAAWDPSANRSVKALAISGTTVYAGGTFTAIDGETRNRIAALDAATGAATDWNPGASSTVHALATSGTTVYAGGEFRTIGGQARNRIAALDAATTGVVTDWDPNANDTVYALALDGTKVWVGGKFSNMGGLSCNRLAALNPATGVATSPGGPSGEGAVVRAIAVLGTTVYVSGTYSEAVYMPPHGTVWIAYAYLAAFGGGGCPGVAGQGVSVLEASGTTIYMAGTFSGVGGQTRDGIAAFDAATGAVTAWTPYGNGCVNTLATSGEAVYVGGEFSAIAVKTRGSIAAFDAATGTPTDWNPNAASGEAVYVRGEFASIAVKTRGSIAAFDAATGTPTVWNPNAETDVYSATGVDALALSGSTVYAGGRFSSIGGQMRDRIAALDAVTGLATDWNPSAADGYYGFYDPSVKALAVSGATVYAAGNFTSIGGQTRDRIAALDAATGFATAWNPDAGGYYDFCDPSVKALVVSGATVYAAGNFTSIGGQTRNLIAALDAATGFATAWNPDADGSASGVHAIAVSGTTVYAGGWFTGIGGQTRNHIAALDAATGLATAWNPNANGAVNAIAVSGTTVYVGGGFTSIGGQTRNRLAALDAATGLATSWNPNVNGTVHAIAVSGTTLYVGGDFTTVGGELRPHFAQFDAIEPTGARDWMLHE